MSLSLQVLYPTTADSTFDFGYYFSTHMSVVSEHMGPYLENTVIAKGLSSGPDTAARYHVIATLLFATQAELDGAMAAAGPVIADIANFYDGQPDMLFGEVNG